MARALDPASVIAGEAVSGTLDERFADMVGIASVIANRAAQLGVSPQDVIANTTEFNAYNRALPPGVNQEHIDLAQQAMDYVAQNGPINNATFYATPAAADNLPSGLSYENATTGHNFYSDPQGRAIGTANGYVTPNAFSYAANPSNVPSNTLNAYAATPQSQDPFGAILGGQTPNWGMNPSVAPALTPTVEGWSAMASAQPMSTPFGPVDPAATAPITQADIDRAFFNPTRQGQFDPSFTANLMGPNNSVVPTAVESTSISPETAGIEPSQFTGFDPARFASVSAPTFDQARMGPLSIDPATNTQSFMDAPAPADLGAFPGAYAAQRGPTTGLNSADAMTVQGMAEKQLAESIANRNVSSISVPSLSAFTAPTSVSPAESAISAQMNQPATAAQQAAGYQQAANSFAKAGMLNIGQQPPTDLSGNLPTGFDVLGKPAPALQTIDIAEQPTIAGPATTDIAPASTQQTQQAVKNEVAKTAQQTTQPSKSPFAGMINKGSIAGSLIGSVAAGPVGGLLGALIGNGINNGSISSPFSSGGFVSPSTQIAGGPTSIGGIYGGAYEPGTYAVANNGATITAQPGGWTSVTTPSGVNETVSPGGQISHNFGSLF